MHDFMRGKCLAITFAMWLAGCDEPPPKPKSLPSGNATLVVDGTTLFVPIAWNAGRPWNPRPWPNGVQIGSGGWGHFRPSLGPIEMAKSGQVYVRSSVSGPPRPDYPDPFFYLTATFEFPLPPHIKTPRDAQRELVMPFSFDRLTLAYEAPTERIERPYLKLLTSLKPTDGEDVGYGWREVRHRFLKRDIALRFDANDWREHGGPLPRRLAASFDPIFWSHFSSLDRPRWTASFDTQALPVEQWTHRYAVADDLFTWLQTSPHTRDPNRRFIWWSDLRYRPPK
jgi:hypothetical protein